MFMKSVEVGCCRFFKNVVGVGFVVVSGLVGVQKIEGFKLNVCYFDVVVEVLDLSFLKYWFYSSLVEQFVIGMCWVEGLVYFFVGCYLLVSDILNNCIMKYDEMNGVFSVFCELLNYVNGNMCDW